MRGRQRPQLRRGPGSSPWTSPPSSPSSPTARTGASDSVLQAAAGLAGMVTNKVMQLYGASIDFVEHHNMH